MADSGRLPDTDGAKISFDSIEWKDLLSSGKVYHNLEITPPMSDWQCTLITNGKWSTTFRPVKGSEPNWFHRKMQELCFGIKWRKVK